MWTPSCNTKAPPKQKSIAARATLSGFGTNLAYNRNKLETTKFIVTLKPIRKQRSEEGSKSPTTSKECCRCEGKVIKGHDKIQVKADDLLKGKTILNAFRLLANSKFITFDKNYEPTNAKILLPPTKLTQQSTENTEQKNDLKTIENKSIHSKKLETKEHINFKTRTPAKSSSDKSNQANLCSDSNLENLKKMIIDRIRKSQEIKIRDEIQKRESALKSCEENQKRATSENGNQQDNNNQGQNQEQCRKESLDQQNPEPSQNRSQDQCQEEDKNKSPSTNENLKANQSQKQKTQQNPKEYLTKAQNIKRNRNHIRSQSESPNPSSNRYAREQNSRNLSQGHNLSANVCHNSYTIPKTVTSSSLNEYKTSNQNQNLQQNQNSNQHPKLKLNHKHRKNQPQNQNENAMKMKNPNSNSIFDLRLNSKSFVSSNQNEQNSNQEKIQIQNKALSQQNTQDITPNKNPISSANHSSSPTAKPIIKPFPYLTKSKNQFPYQNKNLSQTPWKPQNQKQSPIRNRNQNQNKGQNQNPCENVRHNLHKYQTQENQNQNRNKNQTHKSHPTQNQYEHLKENKILREKQNQIENQNKYQTPIQYENKKEYPNQCENKTQGSYTNQEEYHNQDQDQCVSQNQHQSQDHNQFNNIQSQECVVPKTSTNDNLTYDITPTGGNSSENHNPDDGATDDDNDDGNDKDNDAAADNDDDDDKDRLTGGNDNKRSSRSPRESSLRRSTRESSLRRSARESSLRRSARESSLRRSTMRDSQSDHRRDSFSSAQEDLPATYYPPSPPITARRECLLNLHGYTVGEVRQRRDSEPLPREEKRKSQKKKGQIDDTDERDEKDERDGKEKSKRGSWFRQKKKDDPGKSSTAATKRKGPSVSQDPYITKKVIIRNDTERCCDRSCAYRKAVSRQQAFAKQYGNLGCDRIALLENQLEQLRMELGGIRSEVMPNDGDNTRFTALDKRLMELNFLINDMKLNCGGEYSRLSQSSQYPLAVAQSRLTLEPRVEQPTAQPAPYIRKSLMPEPRAEQSTVTPPPHAQARRQEIAPVARESYSAQGKGGRRGTRKKKEEDEEEDEEDLESIQSTEPVVVVEPEIPPPGPFKCEVCDCNSDVDAARKLANCIFIRTKKCTCDNCDCEKYAQIKTDACMLLSDDLPVEEEEEGEEEYTEEELAIIAEQEELQEICRKSGIEAGLAAASCKCGQGNEQPYRKETTNTEDKDTCTEDVQIDDNNNRESDYYDNYSHNGSYGRNSSNSGNYGRSRDESALGQANSFCRYCNNSNYPIIDNNDLCVEVMRRLGQHCVNEIALTILLQSNGLYHINIAVISTGEHIACLYATELAIRCANQTNFFEDIMTFFIVDAKNTHSQKNQILKHTFEFVDDDRK